MWRDIWEKGGGGFPPLKEWWWVAIILSPIGFWPIIGLLLIDFIERIAK